MSSPREIEMLPVFPLTGTLLLPETFLPLNIFEERYLRMVEDALEADRTIGMIQPMIPGLDNFGIPPLDLKDPQLYPVGCCGRIEESELQEDGRYLIVLEGIVRFRIVEELKPRRGYRRVKADIGEFEGDLEPRETAVDRLAVLAALERFARQKDLEFDPDLLAGLSDRRLVNSLSTALPFTPVEKQALIESPTTAERASLLVTLMGFEFEADAAVVPVVPPTIH